MKSREFVPTLILTQNFLPAKGGTITWLLNTYGRYQVREAVLVTEQCEQAEGDVVVTMPSYFQTIPEGLDTVLNALDQGCDVAIARRWPRRDGWVNKLQNF